MLEFMMIRRILLPAALLGTTLPGVSASPVMADPRQDTLAGISRCAGLPNDRTFLDCVYGAAQPLRTELGLTPAPGFQIQLVPPAPGARAVMPPPTAAAPPASVPARAMSAPLPQKTDGLFGNLFDNGSEETLRMASYNFNPRGLFTVTLSNGQVWRQRTNDTAFATWGAKPGDYYATVRAQTTGGYSLVVRGDDGIYQVEPVR
jgi:hypothetical protein